MTIHPQLQLQERGVGGGQDSDILETLQKRVAAAANDSHDSLCKLCQGQSAYHVKGKLQEGQVNNQQGLVRADG